MDYPLSVFELLMLILYHHIFAKQSTILKRALKQPCSTSVDLLHLQR
jgi:hypothetical protein